jgi:predicted nucleotidyltransferase
MSYNISSSKLQHPLLKPILEKLTNYFAELDIQFYVIGATARDIIMTIHEEKAKRATRDLDIAIAISNWDEYEKVEEGILKIDGFKKDEKQKQRFIYNDVYILDIVPFGDIMKEDDRIFWPPDETMAMSVLGFAEVKNSTKQVIIDETLTIEVASLDGIFILKLNAWVDRHIEHNRDADDMGFILNNYLNINEERAATEHYNDIYLMADFNTKISGAKLLGMDMAKIIGDNHATKAKIIKIIQSEIDKEEQSQLINQIIETNKSFSYEETLYCLQNIIEGLK